MALRFGNTVRRKDLLEGLRQACFSLRGAGVTHLFLDGSFVSAKRSPGDWDACYSRVGVIGSQLDPVLLDFTNERAAQKKKYLGEAFIAEERSSGFFGPPYFEFFQTERNTGRKKGIVRLDLGTVS